MILGGIGLLLNPNNSSFDKYRIIESTINGSFVNEYTISPKMPSKILVLIDIIFQIIFLYFCFKVKVSVDDPN